jgi:hypothetical protein
LFRRFHTKRSETCVCVVTNGSCRRSSYACSIHMHYV